MAKEVAISKRVKITEAQEYMFLSVLGASILLGVAISFISYFINQISFNTSVIMAQEESIASYSEVIMKTGVCKKPSSGDIYSSKDLDECHPDEIELSEIEGTLKYNILKNLAANKALNSVPSENDASCKNYSTNKKYTYKELMDKLDKATSSEDKAYASQLIRSCSALRIIPDALPSHKNEEALLASLNSIFNVSGWEPESLSPSGETEASSLAENLNSISLNLSVETDSETTMRVLNNIERSIREFDIKRATFEWGGNNSLLLNASATAYFVNESSIKETTNTIDKNGNTIPESTEEDQ